jgi:hypothetical protein
LLRIGAVGECREPESFYSALARTLGKLTQAVYIILTAGPEIGLQGGWWSVRAAGAKRRAAAHAL